MGTFSSYYPCFRQNSFSDRWVVLIELLGRDRAKIEADCFLDFVLTLLRRLFAKPYLLLRGQDEMENQAWHVSSRYFKYGL